MIISSSHPLTAASARAGRKTTGFKAQTAIEGSGARCLSICEFDGWGGTTAAAVVLARTQRRHRLQQHLLGEAGQELAGSSSRSTATVVTSTGTTALASTTAAGRY
jgi:hypothetical protein